MGSVVLGDADSVYGDAMERKLWEAVGKLRLSQATDAVAPALTLAQKREAIRVKLRAMDSGPGAPGKPQSHIPQSHIPQRQQHAFTVQAGGASFCRRCGEDRLFAESHSGMSCVSRPDDVVRQDIDIVIGRAMDARRRVQAWPSPPASAIPQAWTTSAIAGGASWDLASESFRKAKAREAQAARNYPTGQYE